MNKPEDLIRKVSSYAGIISTRLHPSIISYSLGVPSVGVIWNHKVDMFYETVGRGDKTISVNGITPEAVADTLDAAVREGITRDKKYAMTVYDSLVSSVGEVIGKPDVKPFDFEKVTQVITRFKYKETTEQQLLYKLQNKFRRVYNNYNSYLITKEKLAKKNHRLSEKVKQLKNEQ